MGFLGLFKKKEAAQSHEDKILEGAESNEVIIPDHAKPEPVADAAAQAKPAGSVFCIKGLYDVGSQIMISGTVESGVLKKRMKAKAGNCDLVIDDIKTSFSAVTELPAKTEGSIFVKAKKFPILKSGDLLEFQ